MIRKLIVLVGMSLVYSSSWAQHGMGNGGDAVVCYKDASRNQIVSVDFFDYWEQQQVKKWGAVDLGSAHLPMVEKIKIATRRLAKFDPNLAKIIEKHALNIANNIQSYINNGDPLSNVPDANPAVTPSAPNCFIEQLAVQYKDVQTGQRRFVISDILYNHPSFSADSKVGIILHEAIYRYAILKNDAKNSDGVRFFNYLIASTALETQHSTMASHDYLKILKEVDLKNSECSEENQLMYFVDYSEHTNLRRTCYYQIIKSGTVEVKVPAGTIFLEGNWQDRFALQAGNGNDTSALIEVKIVDKNMNVFQFLTDKIQIERFNIISNGIMPINGSPYPSMYGPLNSYYDCVAIDYRKDLGEVFGCTVADNTLPFKKMTFNGPNRWLLEGNLPLSPSIAYPVAGSKNGLKLSLDYSRRDPWIYGMNRLDRLVIVDQDFKLCAGSANNVEITVYGIPYLIGPFVVEDSHYLKFVGHFYITDPLYKSLRLIESGGNFGIEEYCRELGYQRGSSVENRSEYVAAQPGNFYDVSTREVVHKIDEDVEIITKIRCEAYVVTTDY